MQEKSPASRQLSKLPARSATDAAWGSIRDARETVVIDVKLTTWCFHDQHLGRDGLFGRDLDRVAQRQNLTEDGRDQMD
jgi:hypothetical protein